MELPNSDRAITAREKLVNYLLNIEHERGGSKAKLLIECGYSNHNWQQLGNDIRSAHLSSDVREVKEVAYGIRYIIIAPLMTPSGRQLYVKTIWQIDKGTDIPRLITLLPVTKGR